MLSEKEIECDQSQKDYQKRLSTAEQQHLQERSRLIEDMAHKTQVHQVEIQTLQEELSQSQGRGNERREQDFDKEVLLKDNRQLALDFKQLLLEVFYVRRTESLSLSPSPRRPVSPPPPSPLFSLSLTLLHSLNNKQLPLMDATTCAYTSLVFGILIT